jgi:hypothetical protein
MYQTVRGSVAVRQSLMNAAYVEVIIVLAQTAAACHMVWVIVVMESVVPVMMGSMMGSVTVKVTYQTVRDSVAVRQSLMNAAYVMEMGLLVV